MAIKFNELLKNSFNISPEDLLSMGLYAGIDVVGNVAGNAIGGGRESGVGNALQGASSVLGAIPGPLGAISSAGLNIVGGLTNRVFGSKLNDQKIAEIGSEINQLNNFNSNASSFDDLASNYGMAVNSFSKGDIGKNGLLNHKASDKYKELKEYFNDAYDRADSSVKNNLDNLVQDQAAAIQSNLSAFGGSLDTQGASFPIGYTAVNAGGTHEGNPNEGVPFGVDSQGIPNLVEEGETVFNNYVFSNRLTVPKAMRSKYKLRGTKPLTFADASKKLAREAEERPNDPISQRGLQSSLGGLAGAQEMVKQEEHERNVRSALSKLTPDERQALLSQAQGGQGEEPGITQGGQPFAWGGPVNKFGFGDYLESLFPYSPLLTDTYEYSRPLSIFPTPASQLSPVLETTPSFNAVKPSSDFPDPGKIPNFTNSLSYAPILGSALGLIQSLVSKPDYGNAKRLEGIAGRMGQYNGVRYTPIGEQLTYSPLDRQYAINLLNASAGATRRNILNTSAGNRGTAMAGLLAADYNAGNQLGSLFRQAEESNQAQREKVATFNRATSQYNSENAIKAAMANQSARAQAAASSAGLLGKAVEMRQAIDNARDNAISANFTNFFDNLGGLGTQKTNQAMIDWMVKNGLFGQLGKSNCKGGRLRRKGGKIKRGLTF